MAKKREITTVNVHMKRDIKDAVDTAWSQNKDIRFAHETKANLYTAIFVKGAAAIFGDELNKQVVEDVEADLADFEEETEPNLIEDLF